MDRDRLGHVEDDCSSCSALFDWHPIKTLDQSIKGEPASL